MRSLPAALGMTTALRPFGRAMRICASFSSGWPGGVWRRRDSQSCADRVRRIDRGGTTYLSCNLFAEGGYRAHCAWLLEHHLRLYLLRGNRRVLFADTLRGEAGNRCDAARFRAAIRRDAHSQGALYLLDGESGTAAIDRTAGRVMPCWSICPNATSTNCAH